jgi:chaperonin cofactor prefoldin
MKKGLIGVGLGAAALFALFGTKAVHYTRYAAEKVRENARAAVPFDADVDAAKQQVKALEPAIHSGIETLAKLDQSIKTVEGEIVALKNQEGHARHQIERLRASLDDAGVHRVSDSDRATRRAQVGLERQIDTFRRARYTLQVKESELESRRVQRDNLAARLNEMKEKKEALLSKIQEIEARHDAMQVTREFSDVVIDTSPLADAERAVAELDRRVELEAHTAELRSQFGVDEGIISSEAAESSRDVRREADEILGDGPGRAADKEL